ncbi:TatD family hydrolase [Chondromyces apiculatus]|uniref:Putative deoxyribonuclease YcfH n=1 Tax=Chondromyces apiculatus DSM 436 TaxID=1192034 RepID=A0A017TGH0_9BACT|nr:TatD family hydrolase [Chondromyces apiculatus]EYF07915.1 Putative deoxyribonuclease YcfH [Chondromyces apiculatus DSM 436]
MLIDSHCHLDPAYFKEGADAVLDRAREAGVSAFVVIGVGEDLGPARFAADLATRRPDVSAAVGVHPHDASHVTDAMLTELTELAARPEVVAVGEIGLDYHYMRSPRDVQHRVFRDLIQIARRVKKPIVIHTREAPEDTLALLEQEGASEVGGIIHCFSEDRPFAERALALDFDLSFSGIVTFRTAKAIQEVAAWAPPDRILVETDSPYLAPIPFRGKRCEPAHVAHTARFIADLRGESFEAVAARTAENTRRRLHLPG